MTALPTFIVARLRARIPEGCAVVAGSTPVVAFGDSRTATVATLGLNPSRQEFLDSGGDELVDEMRRFETLRSLGLSRLEDAPQSALERVVDSCCTYFNRRPYRRWFDQLEPVVRAAGASYYDGTACHLDLVQWATDPVWAKLKPRIVRQRLLDEDAAFFLHQLRTGRLRTLLLNGRAVIKGFEAVTGSRLMETGRLSGPVRAPARMLETMLDDVRVLGWTFNLQSSHGVTGALRSELASVVAKALGELSSLTR